MSTVYATFEGADQLKAVLRRIADESRDELVSEVAMEGAREVLPEAISRAPVLKDSDPRRIVGNLKAKISAFMLKVIPGQATAVVGIGRRDMRVGNNAAFYASWVEFGTKKMAAIPFLRPAFDARKDAAEKRMTDFVVKWLDGFSI